MVSHGLVQWTYIIIMTSKVSVIFKSSTWRINGNVRTKQTYLLNFIIVVKSFTRPLLLSNKKLSTQMCQSTSNGCNFSIYMNQTWSLWFPSHTWNIFPNRDLRSRSPCKKSSNFLFFSFKRGPHDDSTKETTISSPC
jgi:hypothetical protein